MLRKSNKSSAAPKGRFVDNRALDKFYLEFENQFRGDQKTIRQRSIFYAELLKRQKIRYSIYPILDVGCGRGEFLEILKEYGFSSSGIDMNKDMVKEAKRKGLDASYSDAVTHLKKGGFRKYGAITGFHIIEHIPFEELITMFRAAYRSLHKNGIVVFETPNPENISVGSCNFYIDPSHLNPLPPALVEYTLKSVGFAEVEILYRNEANPKRKHYKDPMLEELSNRLYGPLDYAVVGYKSKRKSV